MKKNRVLLYFNEYRNIGLFVFCKLELILHMMVGSMFSNTLGKKNILDVFTSKASASELQFQ